MRSGTDTRKQAINSMEGRGTTAANIEPGIRPVCDVLNSIPGVVTAYSCEGHWVGNRSPFVMFDAPNVVAFRIHCLLEHGHGDGRLTLCWWLQARFLDDGSMRYIIETNDYRIASDSWRPSRWSLWRSMNSELRCLADLLAQVKNVGS